MVAAKKGSVGIVRKLMKHGATINLTDKVNVLEFGRKTANSNGPRDYVSTKMMRFMSSQVLELWFPSVTFLFLQWSLCRFARDLLSNDCMCNQLILSVMSL